MSAEAHRERDQRLGEEPSHGGSRDTDGACQPLLVRSSGLCDAWEGGKNGV